MVACLKGYALNLPTSFIAERTVYAHRIFDLLRARRAAQHPADWRRETPTRPAARVDVRTAAPSQPGCRDTVLHTSSDSSCAYPMTGSAAAMVDDSDGHSDTPSDPAVLAHDADIARDAVYIARRRLGIQIPRGPSTIYDKPSTIFAPPS